MSFEIWEALLSYTEDMLEVMYGMPEAVDTEAAA
jgi:hypothetical protein